MTNIGSNIRKDFKDELHSRIEFFHRLDGICRFMGTQLRNCNDMRLLREQVAESKKERENYLENNNSLRQKLKVCQAEKESLSSELVSLKSQEQDVIKSQDIRMEHIKGLGKSYILAMGFYKSRLNCHIEYHKDFIVWTFKNLCTDKKKYMVKLVNIDGRWSCTEMIPKLKTRDAIMETLKKTNDIQGFLCNVRNRFKKIASIKN